MALKLTSKGLETFSSCLLYTSETAYYNTLPVIRRKFVDWDVPAAMLGLLGVA